MVDSGRTNWEIKAIYRFSGLQTPRTSTVCSLDIEFE
jgi:hypothetical protein